MLHEAQHEVAINVGVVGCSARRSAHCGAAGRLSGPDFVGLACTGWRTVVSEPARKSTDFAPTVGAVWLGLEVGID
jgi:hypothetical protein